MDAVGQATELSGPMKRRTKTIVAAAALGTVVAAGAGIAAATTPERTEDANETDSPIPGTDLERASEAALAHTGGGRVTATEVEDEESYYEVEVTLADGRQTDVQLDEQFNVIGAEAEGGEDDE